MPQQQSHVFLAAAWAPRRSRSVPSAGDALRQLTSVRMAEELRIACLTRSGIS